MTSSFHSKQSDGNNNANVKVVVRIRPPNNAEQSERYANVTEAISDHMLVFDPKVKQVEGFLQTQQRSVTGRRVKDLKYAFDHVLKSTARNKDVFEKTTQSIVEAVLNGYNCSVFAYGATGSGKTHTMLGNENEPGVIYHTMLDLYRHIEHLEDEKIFGVAVSYLEIYNETVRDLLKPKKNLPIREDKVAGVMIAGLSLHKPESAEELLRMLHYGNKNRSQHPTDANAESSRSHAVFQVFVKQRPKSFKANSEVHVAKMCLVDLAGSERAIQNRNEGARFREGANINRSLLALGNVINALASKSKGHVPYRDSKLTRLLKDSLGGNCQTVMIATVSPSSRSYEDTYNTLRYADRAKHIKAVLTQNVVSVDQHIVDYKRYVADLERENEGLRAKAKMLQENVKTRELAHTTLSLPLSTVRLFQEQLRDLFKSRKELMRTHIVSEVVKRELKWKLSRKDRAIKRAEKLSGINDVVNKHQKVMDRMHRRYTKEEMSLQRTTQQLREQDESIYGLNAELSNLPHGDQNWSKDLLSMSVRFYVTESYLHDVDMHLCFVKKMARAQERQSAVNERLILSLIQLVKKQHDALKQHNICSPEMEQEYNECTYLVEERGVAWAQMLTIPHPLQLYEETMTDAEHSDKTGSNTGYVKKSSFLVEENEDLNIGDVIDLKVPKIDLNVLKLGSLSPGLIKIKPSLMTEKFHDSLSRAKANQTFGLQKTEKKSTPKKICLADSRSPVLGKTGQYLPYTHVSKCDTNSTKQPSPQSVRPVKRKLMISPQKVENCVDEQKNTLQGTDCLGDGCVKKMVEKYNLAFSPAGSQPEALREQKSKSPNDNSLSSRLKSDSDKLNNTFEIDKPAIPNTPCIDSPVNKTRRLSSHFAIEESTPLKTNSRTDTSCKKSRYSTSLKNVARCQLDYTNANCGSVIVVKNQPVSESNKVLGEIKRNSPTVNSSDIQDKGLGGYSTSRSSFVQKDASFSKCNSLKDPNEVGKQFRASPPLNVKESASLTKWGIGKDKGLKSSKLWRSHSAQRLEEGNITNNCVLGEEGDSDKGPLCSTPENATVNKLTKSSTPQMVVICSPVIDESDKMEEKKEGKDEGIKTPEFKINPYMQTVIESMKKHGIPSLTEQLFLYRSSSSKGLDHQLSSPFSLGSKKSVGYRSPLRLLDVNSSKYQVNRLGKSTPPPEPYKAEQVTMIQPQTMVSTITSATDNSSELGPYGKKRLGYLQERRQQRDHTAKPYSRQTIVTSRGQRLAAALKKTSGTTVGSSIRATSHGAASNLTTTSTSRPGYMSSTFAASQRHNGPEKGRNKALSSIFSLPLKESQRKLVTGLRNKSSFQPWANIS